jgi:deoxyribodipyrimidine photo-lyase
MEYTSLLESLDQIDPVRYGKTRNFTNGAVSRLSPYIARGILDTKTILENIATRGFSFYQAEKFIQQLAWRDYFQRVWQTHGDSINNDLKNPQESKFSRGLPSAISKSTTGIESIDESLDSLQKSGYMHNHVRMYVAFMACNLAGFHWRGPAHWMYYYLLDGDWGSNALSWQWVAGTFSNKKYIANQENINYYTNSKQRGSYLDCSYEELAVLQAPSHLLEADYTTLTTTLPTTGDPKIDTTLPTFIYNYYNLSPTWRESEKANRVLLLEPEHFKQYPISDACIKFMMEQATKIPDLQVHIGGFTSLKELCGNSSIYYREHPLNAHYSGHQDERTWLINVDVPVQGSFFSFWKKVEKQIKKTYFK